MKTVSFYHKDTGALHPSLLTASDDAAVELNCPPDHAAIDGHHDHRSLKVNIATGELEPSGIAATADSFASAHHIHHSIRRLETDTIRALREAVLGHPDALKRLQDIDGQIAEFRKQLDKG